VPGPSTPAPRLRAPSWRDRRLVVGVLLVLASVLLGSWVVGTADRTRPVWAAASTLAPGDPVREGSLRVVRVHLDGDAAAYLPADRALPEHLVALRTVGAGELLPGTAVGDAARLDRRAVGLPVASPLPRGLVKGAQVDVWVSGPSGPTGEERATPRLLAPGAEVAEVASDDGAFGSGSATVQVLLGQEELPDALAALADDARVALVVVPGTTPEG
jgi:hypothetical protein